MSRVNHWLKMHTVIIEKPLFEAIFELNKVTDQPIRHNFNPIVIINLLEIHDFCLQLNDGLLL